MSRKERFTPQEKEQACIDYIEGNRSRSEICRELYISTSTMNIPVLRVLPHENIQMVGLTTTELSNKTSNNWLNGIAIVCQAPLFFHSRHWKNFCISSGERRTFQFHSSASRKSRILRCLIPSRLISSSSIVTTYFGKLSRTPANAPNSRWMVSSEASR